MSYSEKHLSSVLIHLFNRLQEAYKNRVWRAFYKCQLLYKNDNNATEQESNDGSVSELVDENFDNLNFHQNPTGREKSLTRLEKGQRFFYMEKDGKVAGYAWVSLQSEISFSYVSQSMSLEKVVYYIYDCYTAKSYRGQKIYRKLLKSLLYELSDKDIYVACRAHNKASMYGIEKSGFRRIRRFMLFNFIIFSIKFDR